LGKKQRMGSPGWLQTHGLLGRDMGGKTKKGVQDWGEPPKGVGGKLPATKGQMSKKTDTTFEESKTGGGVTTSGKGKTKQQKQ